MIMGKSCGLLLSSLLILLLAGCSTVKYVPVEKVVKETIRDTIILHPDTIRIKVEKERFKEVIPEMDTSYLETSVARSTAFLDTARRVIHHTLEQKEVELEKEVVLQEKIVYKDRIIEEQVPVEVEVPQKYIPSWVWYALGIGWGLLALLCFIRFKF